MLDALLEGEDFPVSSEEQERQEAVVGRPARLPAPRGPNRLGSRDDMSRLRSRAAALSRRHVGSRQYGFDKDVCQKVFGLTSMDHSDTLSSRDERFFV